jgi:hypothetical protein
MTSEYPKMCKQDTPGKMKHVTIEISQKLEIIRNIENCVCEV